MTPKFIVVNNGLKDLRGHYFETSVSVAEAARDCGYQPILASHVACPSRLIPSWLEFYPLFCTDHWMIAPAPPPPDLRGIRGDATACARASLKDPSTLGDYLRAHFEPVAFPEPSTVPSDRSAPPAPPRHWKASVKKLLRATVPPALVPILRRMWQGRRAPVNLARMILPPLVFSGGRALYRKIRPRPEVCPPSLDLTPALPQHVPAIDPLAEWLMHTGAPEEYGHVQTYQRDLERLLCLTGANCHDHVFMPTAHARELVAIQRILATLPEKATPTFHLEFRHALDIGVTADNPDYVHPYTACLRTLFDFSRRQPLSPQVRLYTDTEELSEAYRDFSGLDFATLPIPFRTHLISDQPRKPESKLCIAFFGDVRDEKKFDWLPELVQALTEDGLVPGKVHFLVQATLVQPEWNPQSHQALLRLKQMPGDHVRLVGLNGPLSPAEYYRLFSEADLLLCAYDRFAYHRRSSGTLTEAVAAGIPTVVPEDTWLARQQPSGAGESCSDLPSFIEAVRRICNDYPRYLAQARAAKDRWLSVHTPLNLVKTLVEPAAATLVARMQAGKAA